MAADGVMFTEAMGFFYSRILLLQLTVFLE